MRYVAWFSGGNLSPEDLDLDGHDVWRAISYGDDSPRLEILHNIDIESFPDSQLGFAYQGIGLRLGDMKLLMGVPNISYFIPPEDRDCTQTNRLSLQDLESVSVKSIRVQPPLSEALINGLSFQAASHQSPMSFFLLFLP